MGGVVAFEMACQLVAAGEQVSGIVALDSLLPTPDTPIRDQAGLREVAQLAAETERSVPWPPPNLRPRLEAALTAEGLSVEVLAAGASTVRRLVEVMLAHGDALRSYTPRHFDGIVELLLADDGLAASPKARKRIVKSWTDHARDVRVREVRGDHLSVVAEPHVRGLAEELAAIVESALGQTDAKPETLHGSVTSR